MELLKRLDNQKIHWKPDRAAPVRISAKQTRARLTGFVVQTMLGATDTQHIGMILVISRDSPDSVRREELVFIEHIAQNTPKFVAIHNRQQPPFAHAGREHARLVLRVPGAIRNKPIQTTLEIRESLQQIGLERVDG